MPTATCSKSANLSAPFEGHRKLRRSQVSILGPLGPCCLLPQLLCHLCQKPVSQLRYELAAGQRYQAG